MLTDIKFNYIILYLFYHIIIIILYTIKRIIPMSHTISISIIVFDFMSY